MARRYELDVGREPEGRPMELGYRVLLVSFGMLLVVVDVLIGLGLVQ